MVNCFVNFCIPTEVEMFKCAEVNKMHDIGGDVTTVTVVFETWTALMCDVRFRN
jgi:hypothetical protein